ncbi:MAG: BamA/TamA family outer membrane protein [Proteobacteria bacterium]|nr:BamA/TamA family outer membrane protein [Pseudomonadota bacterium]
MIFRKAILILVVFCVLPIPGLALETLTEPINNGKVILEIVVKGNEKTKKKIILQEMTIGVGDLPLAKTLEESRQAIRDLSLFKSVKLYTEPMAGGRRLIVEVKEKIFLLPVPRLKRNADGDVKYGAQIRWSNVAGLNQTLKITAEKTDYNDESLQDKDTFRIEYLYPRFNQSVYDVDFKYEYDQSEAENISDLGVYSLYDEDTYSSRIRFSRWWSTTGVTQGWRVGAGLAINKIKYGYVSGELGLFEDSKAVSVLANIGHHDVHEKRYSRYGEEYGYNISYAWERLGSDYDAAVNELYIRQYKPISDTPHRNINTQFRIGFSNASGNRAFDLGDSSRLRGYERDQVVGNAYVLLNLQYLAPLPNYESFRYVVFADIGNAYKDVRNINLSELESSAGIGFRWKLRTFVKTYLRLDWAYGLGSDKAKVYGSTSAMF